MFLSSAFTVCLIVKYSLKRKKKKLVHAGVFLVVIMFKMRERNKSSGQSFMHSSKLLVIVFYQDCASSEAVTTLHFSCINIIMIQWDEDKCTITESFIMVRLGPELEG